MSDPTLIVVGHPLERWWVVIAAAFVSLVVVGSSFRYPLGSTGNSSMADGVIDLILITYAASFGLVAYRSWRRRVEVLGADGLRVVNMFKTVTVPWSDIEEIGVGRSGLYPRVGKLRLRDGSYVVMSAVQAGGPVARSRTRVVLEMLAQLNSARREWDRA
jgi:hypothetical protein